jgi:hypothetical protein
MNKQIAVIVEGVKREKGYWNSIEKVYFAGTSLKIVPLSANGNLYMIWQQIQEDDNETDIIEVIRELSSTGRAALEGYKRDDFQEVYLFFDYDPQQKNLGLNEEDMAAILEQMVQTFNNETENGKLYISYPMSEALRDTDGISCVPLTACLISRDQLARYKQNSAVAGMFTDPRKYDLKIWNLFISVFLKRCLCLFKQENSEESILSWFKSSVNNLTILEKENALYQTYQKVFVLSAFPEFILDYFPPEHFDQVSTFLRAISEKECNEKNFMLKV